MAKAKKQKKSKSNKSKGGTPCACGLAKPARIKDAHGSGRHTMCRDIGGVTRKSDGKHRQPGSFSKAAKCQ